MSNMIDQKKEEIPEIYKYCGDVPCDGCRICCIGDAIRLLNGDFDDDGNPRFFSVQHPLKETEFMIDHKPNGECIYLDEKGCTVHDDKPVMCRTMDCRNIAATITFTHARKYEKDGLLIFSIWKKGRELIKGADDGKKNENK